MYGRRLVKAFGEAVFDVIEQQPGPPPRAVRAAAPVHYSSQPIDSRATAAYPPVVKTRLTGVGTSATLPVGVSSPVCWSMANCTMLSPFWLRA